MTPPNFPPNPVLSPDPSLWLEQIEGEAALSWVDAQSARTEQALGQDAGFAALEARLLAQLTSQERIPGPSRHGEMLYNFWQDARNPKGLWRRCTLEQYRQPAPAWETVLDLDALAALESEPWVWHGETWYAPHHTRALISLSRGGGDASVLREFDVLEKRFVEGGFVLPESKGSAVWLDPDTLLVARDFGEGTLTTSGYPRQVRQLVRGQALEEADFLLEAAGTDMGVWPWQTRSRGQTHTLLNRKPTFYSGEYHLLREGGPVRLDLPEDAEPQIWGEHLLVVLRSGWRCFAAGAVLVALLEPFLAGEPRFEALYVPDERSALRDLTLTRSAVLIGTLENVQSRLYRAVPTEKGWTVTPLELPMAGTADTRAYDPDESDAFWLTLTDFVTPPCLYLAQDGNFEKLKALPAFFDATGLRVEQREVNSRDGERVPYFLVARADLEHSGDHPTLLYGYGGFEIPLLSGYTPGVGIGWLERGGVYAVANIRGGGEFGPRWHRAALRENRQRAFDDFGAVAEDLIGSGITSSARLGIWGGSNGGLLVGNMLTQRPELFRAVVCQVPLLDMRRYPLLLAGASWVAEYGDPENPQDWAFLQHYSPYHTLRADVSYPRVLFTTSTRDDRVHPAHARKMAARMLELGHDVLFWENREGGHGGAADARQRAHMQALIFRFLERELMGLSEAPA